MAGELFEVPLFPLSVVLFPGMALPLHIFEPRYRQMTAHCLADQAPFGIVLALPEGERLHEVPARVGTFARIADCEKLPDGRYNLLARGTHRFEIMEMGRDRAYLTGLVRPYQDCDDAEPPAVALVGGAREALHRYLRMVFALVGGDEEHIAIPDDASELSFLMGMCLSDDDDKQRLLEMTSLVERLRTVERLLRVEVELLAQQMGTASQLHPSDDRTILN